MGVLGVVEALGLQEVRDARRSVSDRAWPVSIVFARDRCGALPDATADCLACRVAGDPDCADGIAWRQGPQRAIGVEQHRQVLAVLTEQTMLTVTMRTR